MGNSSTSIRLLKKRRILTSDITNASFDALVNRIAELGRERQSAYVCVSSVHMIIEALWDKAFNAVLNNAAMATPDGKPVSVFMNLIYGTRQEQIAGHNLMLRLFQKAEADGLSIFFYGSTEDVLTAICEKLRREYPGLTLAGTVSPPFRPLTDVEDEAMTRAINASGAHIVLVALGCPKQETWMAEHQGKIQAVMVGLGAAFPFYTGHVKRAPIWMQRFCLEWFYRILMEPRRLLIRYLTTNPVFLALILKQWIEMRLFGKSGG